MNKNENRAADNFGSLFFPKRTGGFFMQANSQKRRARKTALEFAGYVAPAVFFITLFVGIPFVMCIYYPSVNGTYWKTSEFIGLENIIRLFTNDPAFVSAAEIYLYLCHWNSTDRKCTCHFFCRTSGIQDQRQRIFQSRFLYSQYHKPCYHWIYLEIYLYQSI